MRTLLLWLIAAPGAHDHHHPHAALAASAPAATSLFNLEQKWTDDSGKRLALASLDGDPLVIAMVYTTCQAACPLIVSGMKRIETALTDTQKKRVRFALFSFDPSRDTVKRLREYRRERGLGDRWILLRAGEGEARELAALLGVKYARLANGDYQHSNIISIADAGGVVQRQVNGLGALDKGAVAELVRLLR